MLEFILDLDTQLFHLLNTTISNGFFDVVMPFITNKQNWIIPFGLVLGGMLLAGSNKTRIAVLILILSVATADMLCYRVLKPAFHRSRPSHALEDARVLGKKGGSHGFPSNHAANITAAMTVLAFVFRRRKWQISFFAIAALVSFSRIYVGVHYPLDVLAGAAVGAGCGLLWLRLLTNMGEGKDAMGIAIIRKIDFWFGIPLCWLLTVFERFRSSFPRRSSFSDCPENILFIELSEMGSAIIAYSALQKTRELYPGAKLFFLIFDENQESVHLINTLPKEHVLTIRHKSPIHFLSDTLRVVWKMRKLSIDTTIDMELFSRATCILSYLSGAQRRAGFYQYRMEGLYRGNLLTHKVQYNVYQHVAYNFLNLVYALQAPSEETPKLKRRLIDTPTVPRLESTDEEKARIWAKLKAIQPELKDSDTLVVLNPNAGLLPIRAWPLEKYVELARRLIVNDSLYIVIMGIKGAAEDAVAIRRAVGGRCIDMTNKTANLWEVIDLFQVSDVLVTNDSGPAHFASLTPIKNFIFFGPETPELYAPLGEYTFPIFAHYSCSPCLSAFNHRNTPCTDPQCIKNIPVDEVYRMIVTQLELSTTKHTK